MLYRPLQILPWNQKVSIESRFRSGVLGFSFEFILRDLNSCQIPIVIHRDLSFFLIDDDTFGIATGRIPDNALFSSSALNQACGASQARLNKQPCKEKYGAWSPMYNDKNQYLDIDLGKLLLLLLDAIKLILGP